MLEKQIIQIESKYVSENLIQFLKHTEQAKNLVVIFPGGNNSTDIPILHYALKVALAMGCDVLSLKYGISPSKHQYTDQEVYETIIEECHAAISKVNYGEYSNVVFISKSVGNLIAVDVEERYFEFEPIQVFYTPVEGLVRKINNRKCLIFTGGKDKMIKPESVEWLKTLQNVEVNQFPNAVHSLEVNVDFKESLKILNSTTEILYRYLAEALAQMG